MNFNLFSASDEPQVLGRSVLARISQLLKLADDNTVNTTTSIHINLVKDAMTLSHLATISKRHIMAKQRGQRYFFLDTVGFVE